MALSTAALCLALNVYHEARGERDAENQILKDAYRAVAHLTLVRAKYKEKRVCDVVFKPAQFSWANALTMATPEERLERSHLFLPRYDNPIEAAAWAESKRVAIRALGGAYKFRFPAFTHYYNPKKVKRTPRWAKKLTRVQIIGSHHYYMDTEKNNETAAAASGSENDAG